MTKHKTALIVEDSPAQALTLRRLLEEEGLEVLWASNGQIGLSMAKDNLPDVVVLDIEMPEMNGFEALHHLKEDPQTAQIPVILLTVHTEPISLIQGVDLGAIDFIPKDAFSGSVLLGTLRQLGILEDSDTATSDKGGQSNG
jgi:twitching motility two-component system response regulator PilH